MEVASKFHILFGKESLIDPIRLHSINHTTDQRAIELIEIINMCNFRYREIEKKMNNLIDSFQKLGSDFILSSINIDQEINKLN